MLLAQIAHTRLGTVVERAAVATAGEEVAAARTIARAPHIHVLHVVLGVHARLVRVLAVVRQRVFFSQAINSRS